VAGLTDDAITTDPEEVCARARATLERFRAVHPSGATGRWLDRWSEILDSGADAVMHTLTSMSEEAIDLRQNSPFAGVLTEDERRRALEAFARTWRSVAA
jgi:hypothetical protein